MLIWFRMDHNQLVQYGPLINRPNDDWIIYYWITGKEAMEYNTEVMNMLKDHVNNDKERTSLSVIRLA